MSIPDRLADAEVLWSNERREGALLSVLVAVSATAQRVLPDVKGDRSRFETFLKSTHDWKVEVEYRGGLIDLDHLFYKWLRCSLVHEAALPPDLRFDERVGDSSIWTVRAGGAPDHCVLLSLGWYGFFSEIIRGANPDLFQQAGVGEIG